MNELEHDEHRLYRLGKNRFVVMISMTIVASWFLVGVALALYASSGAAQVDLSRPGYSSIRDQVEEDNHTFKAFSSLGPIDDAALDEFAAKYSETAKSITSIDAFDADVLSDRSLRITENK